MRAVIQRVSYGAVSVDEEKLGAIVTGLVILLGVGEGDTVADARYLAEKTVNLRIFEDEAGKMNLSALEVQAGILVVSQFTLYGDCRKGRRPNFTGAAKPELANELYEQFVNIIKEYGLRVETGRFQAMMKVEIHNDGPVTLLLDSKKEF